MSFFAKLWPMCGLLIVICSVDGDLSYGWEFRLSGAFERKFTWIERTGPNDLFGQVKAQDDPDHPRLVGLAGPNIFNTGALPTVPQPSSNFMWNLGSATGRQTLITRGGFSSSGMSAKFSETRLSISTKIDVNQAVSVYGNFNIGGYRNKYNRNSALGAQRLLIPPFEASYLGGGANSASDTISLIGVQGFWVSADLPWGRLSVGPRSFMLGAAATFGPNARLDTLLMEAPYGPFKFSLGIIPTGSPYRNVWSQIPDSQVQDLLTQMLICSYSSGNLQMGWAAVYRNFDGKAIQSARDLMDETELTNLLFIRYNSGRIFLNAEYAWFNLDRHAKLAVDPTVDYTGTQFQTLFLEGFHFFGEGGLVMGPAKLTMGLALASGPVLNDNNRLRNVHAGGFFLGPKTPAPFEPGKNPKIYAAFPINYEALAPYQFLIFETYAGGNNGGWNALDKGFVSDEHGMLTDGYCLTGRIDYAVASNLNVWFSYLWAHRLEKAGTYFGQYQSSGSLVAGSIPNLVEFYQEAGRSFEVGDNYVSNGWLGEEFNLGVDWKLLEGLTLTCRYGKWRPGPWFVEAYQAITVERQGEQTEVKTTGVLLERNSIHGIKSSMVIEF